MIGLERKSLHEKDVNKIWNQMARIIRNVARDTLGVTSRKVQEQKEACWWNEETQERVKSKQNRFRELMCCQEEKLNWRRTIYKEVRHDAKNIVAEVKDKAYEAMYKHLNTKDGENKIYRLSKTSERRQLLSKTSERRQRDLEFDRFIKDEDERVVGFV